MPKQLSLQTLLDVIQALGIDVPILRAEEDAHGAVTIYLYGGEVKHWPPAATAVIASEAKQSPPSPFQGEGRGEGEYPNPPVTRLALQKVADKSKIKNIRVHPLLSVSICVKCPATLSQGDPLCPPPAITTTT